MDTIRIYEAVLAGAIPLIESTVIWQLHRQYGLILRSWDELMDLPDWPLMELPTHELLKESYWKEQVAVHQMRCIRTRN